MDEERPDTVALEQEVRELRALLGAALTRIDELDRSLASEGAPAAPGPSVGSGGESDGTAGDGGRLGRRQAIKGAVLAAGATAAGMVVADATPAAAVNGNAIVLGTTGQTASSATTIQVSGSNQVGFGVGDNGVVTQYSPAIVGYAKGTAFSIAVEGYAEGTANALHGLSKGSGAGVVGEAVSSPGVYGTNPNGPGVRGYSFSGIGVAGDSSGGSTVSGVKGASSNGRGVHGSSTADAGVLGESVNGFGVRAASTNSTGLKSVGKVYGVIAQSFSASPTDAALAASSLQAMGIYVSTDDGLVMSGSSGTNGGIEVKAPKFHLRMGNAETRGAPTADGFAHQSGEVVYTTAGETWACVASGTPGVWRKVASPAAAGAFHVLPTPVRIYDSRAGSTPAQGPKTKLPPGGAGRPLDCRVNGSGVPTGATAVSLTILLVNASNGNGNFTVWANGAAKPASNTMVWGAGSGRWTTSTISALDASAKIQVAASAETDLVIDVVGYYR